MARLAEAVLNPPNSLWYLVPVYCSLEVKSSAQYVSPVIMSTYKKSIPNSMPTTWKFSCAVNACMHALCIE